MVRSLLWPASLLLLSPAAGALPTARSYEVLMDTLPVGTLTLHGLVAEQGEVSCRYTARWTGLAGPVRFSQTCLLDESKAGDHFDCQENRRGAFATLVSGVAGACSGFDEFGQKTQVPALVGGETPAGAIYGVVMTASVGDVEGLTIAPRKQSVPLSQSRLPAIRQVRPVLILP